MSGAALTRPVRHGFAGYIAAVRRCFAFLTGHGFGAPRIRVLPPRECSIVYWGAAGTNVAIFHDCGGPPWVSIVPLPMRHADGSTRSFGLNEAMAVLAPAYLALSPGPLRGACDPSLEPAWLDWYAGFLRAHAGAVVPPSPGLLERIEVLRPTRCSTRVRFSS